jgi:hypothetical protein
MNFEIMVFYFITPCRLEGGYRCFEGICRLHLQSRNVLGAEFGPLRSQVSGLWNQNHGNGNDGNKLAHALERATVKMLT